MRRAAFLGFCWVLLSTALSTLPADASMDFVFDPRPTYKSVSETTTLVEFPAPIRSLFPGGDDLFVVFDPHLPPGWFAQYCQVSTGLCFPDDHAIHLRNSDPDTLRVDFRPVAGDIGTGYIDIRIYRVANPADWKEVTLALGHGVTLPVSNYSFISADAFKETEPWTSVDFNGQIHSLNAFNDSLIVEIQRDTPVGWVTQWCQTSTGQCYPDMHRIAFNAFVTDTLRVDFLCYASVIGIGHVRIKTHSVANPAIWYALPFRVRTGEIPASVDEGADQMGSALRVVPNPVRGAADFEMRLPSSAPVRLLLVDLSGRVVLDRMTAPLGPGVQKIRWDGKDSQGNELPSGIYFYSLEGAGTKGQGKLTIER
jgi:hypothetical protein